MGDSAYLTGDCLDRPREPPGSPTLERVDEHYERLRARLLEAIAKHERGELDHAGLQAAVEAVRRALDNTQHDVRRALFEADIALEQAQFGRSVGGADPALPLRRMRRNLREALR
jgi:hypothetical protein